MLNRAPFVAVAVLFPLLAAPAGAQRAAHDTLSAVVVTATREPVASAVPTATTTVLRGDDLRAAGITRVADALRLVPGAAVVGSGAVGSLTSLFLRGGNSNYVRVLVDGVPMNDAGGGFDFSTLTIANIDRIEVLRGPASVLYGSDAVTGVVQLFTRQGAGPLAWHALAGGGSRGAEQGELGLSAGSATAGFSLLGSRQASNGDLAFNDNFATNVLSLGAHAALDHATRVAIAARWSSASFHYPTKYDGTVSDHNAEQAEHRLVTSAEIDRQLSEKLSAHLTLTQNEDLPRSNDAPDSPADTLGFFGYFSRSTRVRRAAELRLTAQLGARTTLTVGGEVARDRESTSSLSLSQYGNSAGAFEASRHTDALYAQLLGDASPRLSYVAGARVDRNSAFGSFATARGGLAWRGGPAWRVRLSAGNAFKAPSFYENFATGYVTGNPALRPERSTGGEVGADAFLLDGVLVVRGTVYAQQFRDLVQYAGTAPSPGAPNYYNVAGATARGVEIETEWRPSAATTVRASYAYTDTRATAAGFDASSGATYVVGERLIRRPPHAASLFVARTFGRASLDLIATRVGARDDRDFAQYPVAPVQLPAYTTLDGSLVLPLGRDEARPLALVLRVSNALDARYEEIARFAAPRRAWFAGLRWGR